MKGIMTDGKSIKFMIGEFGSWDIIDKGVTGIVPYYEGTEEHPELWFAVMNGDVVVTRVNGKYVGHIEYLEG